MFTLKIHTVDFPQPLHTAAAHRNDHVKPVQLMGVAHLFHHLPSTTAPAITVANISARTTHVFVVAVPNYMSVDDFLLFCGKDVSHFEEIVFLRNDAMEDRYSVLIKLENQMAADGFYCSYNGRRFKPTEVEVCHIYFAQSVENTESAEIASIPPPDYTELPSCPVCLERLDPDTSGIQSTLCDHSFHCSCVSKWTYFSCTVCRLCQQQDEGPACAICGTFKNLWICLICGFVGCGRYEQGHASEHWSDKHHQFSLGLEKQQIWDYVGERYVHRLNQSKADAKSVAVNSRCTSVEDCGTCGYGEDEGLAGALFSSKIEGILDEYNHLPAMQLDEQRQQYETLLAEARSRKESSIKTVVDRASTSGPSSSAPTQSMALVPSFPESTIPEAPSSDDMFVEAHRVFVASELKKLFEAESSRLTNQTTAIVNALQASYSEKLKAQAITFQKTINELTEENSKLKKDISALTADIPNQIQTALKSQLPILTDSVQKEIAARTPDSSKIKKLIISCNHNRANTSSLKSDFDRAYSGLSSACTEHGKSIARQRSRLRTAKKRADSGFLLAERAKAIADSASAAALKAISSIRKKSSKPSDADRVILDCRARLAHIESFCQNIATANEINYQFPANQPLPWFADQPPPETHADANKGEGQEPENLEPVEEEEADKGRNEERDDTPDIEITDDDK